MSSHVRYCERCGHALGQVDNWPVTCSSCQRKTYKNPIPVVVVLLPTKNPEGLLTIRRGKGNGAGELALPGGFVDWSDNSWQAAAARELHEEVGIRVRESDIQLLDVLSAPDKTLLLFCLGPCIDLAQTACAVTDEATEIRIIDQPAPMAFSLHEQVIEKYFAK